MASIKYTLGWNDCDFGFKKKILMIGNPDPFYWDYPHLIKWTSKISTLPNLVQLKMIVLSIYPNIDNTSMFNTLYVCILFKCEMNIRKKRHYMHTKTWLRSTSHTWKIAKL